MAEQKIQASLKSVTNDGTVRRYFLKTRAKDVDISETSDKKTLDQIDLDGDDSTEIKIYKTYEDYIKDYTAGLLTNVLCVIEEDTVDDDDVDNTTVTSIINYLKTTNYFDYRDGSQFDRSGTVNITGSTDIMQYSPASTLITGLVSITGYVEFDMANVAFTGGATSAMLYIELQNYDVNKSEPITITKQSVFISNEMIGVIDIPITFLGRVHLNDDLTVKAIPGTGMTITDANYSGTISVLLGGTAGGGN